MLFQFNRRNTYRKEYKSAGINSKNKVPEKVSEPGFPDTDDDGLDVAPLDPLLRVGHAFDVEGRVRQDGVHEGQPEDAKEPVDQSCVKI